MSTQTNEQKLSRVCNEFKVSKKAGQNIVYMLDWMTEKRGALKDLHRDFIKDTRSAVSFDEFCYGLWPRCMNGYMKQRKQVNN